MHLWASDVFSGEEVLVGAVDGAGGRSFREAVVFPLGRGGCGGDQ